MADLTFDSHNMMYLGSCNAELLHATHSGYPYSVLIRVHGDIERPPRLAAFLNYTTLSDACIGAAIELRAREVERVLNEAPAP